MDELNYSMLYLQGQTPAETAANEKTATALISEAKGEI